jgi:hypothetical protein
MFLQTQNGMLDNVVMNLHQTHAHIPLKIKFIKRSQISYDKFLYCDHAKFFFSNHIWSSVFQIKMCIIFVKFSSLENIGKQQQIAN